MQIYPNFLLIGAMKAGSTTLYEYLKQHPDIYMSEPKEPEFFSIDKNYSKGLNFYKKNFSGLKEEKMVGETSTSYSNYIGLEKIVKRIYEFNNQMKLIYILRNPISRAYSAYFWRVRQQYEKLSFEEALNVEETRENDTKMLDPYSYKRIGLYFQIINTFLKLFHKDKLMIVLLDDLHSSPQNTCNRIFNFLKVEEFMIKPIRKKNQNPAGLPKNKFVQNMIGKPNKLRNTLESVINRSLGEKTKHKIYHYIVDSNIQEFSLPTMKETTFDYLAKYFEEDITNLEKFLKRDLSKWRDSKKIICKS